MVVMIPGPYSEVSSGFTTAQMKTRGMNLQSKENIDIDGLPSVLMNVTQSAYGIEFGKWIAVFGDDSKTIIITATFPKSREDELSGQLKSTVLNTKLDQTPPPDTGADLNFSIVPSDKLKITHGIGKTLLYTKDGVIPAKSVEDPVFIAAPSFFEVPIPDKRQFAVQRLFQTATIKVHSLISNAPVTIDGLDGYESFAEAEHADSGTPLVLYQVVLFDEGSYILMQGLVGAKLSDEYLFEFRAMARSLTRKQR